MTEMYRRGYQARRDRELMTIYGGGDPVPILLEQVERVAAMERIEAVDLLDKLTEALAEGKEEQAEEPTLVMGIMVYDDDEHQSHEDHMRHEQVIHEMGRAVTNQAMKDVMAGHARRTQPHFDARGNDNGGRISGR